MVNTLWMLYFTTSERVKANLPYEFEEDPEAPAKEGSEA